MFNWSKNTIDFFKSSIRKRRMWLVSIFFLLACRSFYGQQQHDPDSLRIIANKTDAPDSVRLLALHNLAWHYLFIQPDSALLLANKELNWAVEIKSGKWEANAYNTIASYHFFKGEYPKAMDYHHKSLKLREELGDKRDLAKSLNNIGIIFDYQSDYEKAIEFYQKSLRLKEEIGDSIGISDSYGNIGIIYSKQKKHELALEYCLKALGIKIRAGDKRGMANFFGNVGLIYQSLGNTSKALEYNLSSLEQKAALKDNYGLAGTYGNIGRLYLDLNNTKEAINNCEKGLEISLQIHALDWEKLNCKCLSDAYERTENYQMAYKYFQKYIAAQDSLINEENTRMITRREMRYEFDKQQYADSLQRAEANKVKELEHRQEIDRQKIYTYTGVGGFILMLTLAFVLLRGYRQKQRSNRQLEEKNLLISAQKQEVENQRNLVEVKNKEITDSIQYAKRIQSAILPSKTLVKNYLRESFVLYKPKDIVAGDFYWMEALDSKVFFAAADCTGHGVPGAMVSVMCSNALTRAVKELSVFEPGKILDETTGIVEEHFSKSEEEVKDGMDVALCCLDLEKNVLQYAGANNPLWIARKGELIETKADKQPIGKFENRKPFTNHTIELQKADCIYVFSDGYPDQFGGPKGKKFKYAKLKELLLTNADKSMAEQKEILDLAFNEWKRELEQVDDVCVIGVRI